MNWKYLFSGIGLLLAAYFIYKEIKGGPSSEKNNWEGTTLSLYIQCWGGIIVCVLCGIVFIVKSFLS